MLFGRASGERRTGHSDGRGATPAGGGSAEAQAGACGGDSRRRPDLDAWPRDPAGARRGGPDCWPRRRSPSPGKLASRTGAAGSGSCWTGCRLSRASPGRNAGRPAALARTAGLTGEPSRSGGGLPPASPATAWDGRVGHRRAAVADLRRCDPPGHRLAAGHGHPEAAGRRDGPHPRPGRADRPGRPLRCQPGRRADDPAGRCTGSRSSWPPRAAWPPTSPSATAWSCSRRPPRSAQDPALQEPVLLPAAARRGRPRQPGAPPTVRALAADRPAQRRPADRPVRHRLPPSPRPAGRLPAGTPARVDYVTLVRLADTLGRLFWDDLEAHHPGISSLRLDPRAAAAWKQRILTKTIRQRQPDGSLAEIASSAGERHQLPDHGPQLLPRHRPVGDGRPGPVGTRGPPPARSGPATSRTRRPPTAASPAWTSGPASGCPSCPPWSPPPTASARPPPSGWPPPGPPRPARCSPPAGQTLRRTITTRAARGQRLGRRPRRRPAAQPDPRGAPRVLGLGRGGSAAPYRHPGRGADRAVPPQPGPVPAPRHRRADPAAAHRPVQDRHRAAPGHQPRARRRPVRDHLPDPRR